MSRTSTISAPPLESPVGIIANPASGKDIRRLVSFASVFDNHEKVHILERALRALDALGVGHVLYMPDYYDLMERAIKRVKPRLQAEMLPMDMYADERDTTEAARRLREAGAGCIITLGGDGTNRAVAKASGDVPLVAISTGTNNVFPTMLESTVAGLAAGLLAAGRIDPGDVSHRSKRLEISVDGRPTEIALIDVVSSTELFIGSRALWEPARIREIVLSRAEPGCIGMSSVGGGLEMIGPRDPAGLYLRLGPGGRQVLAAVGPGLVVPVAVAECRRIAMGEEVALEQGAGTLAVDGERQLELLPGQRVSVRLSDAGPRLVDVQACLRKACQDGILEDLPAELGVVAI